MPGHEGVDQQCRSCVKQQGHKKALLVSINYFDDCDELQGCIDCAKNVSVYLMDNARYMDENMLVLTDDQHPAESQPTKQNILRALHWLANMHISGITARRQCTFNILLLNLL
jgi:hypothetical protein